MNKFITLSLVLLLQSSSSLLHGMEAEKSVSTEAEIQRFHFEIFCREDTFFKYEKKHVLAYVKNPENDINEKFPRGWIFNGREIGKFPQQCLHRACMENAMEIVEALLSRPDVIIDECNDFGATPLSYACVNSSADMVSLLLGNGADVNNGDALYSACFHGRTDIVKLLIAHKDININKGKSEKPIFLAARMNLSIFDILLNCGKVDIHTKNDNNQTVFYVAWFCNAVCGGWIGERRLENLTIIHQDGAQRKKFLEDELHALVNVYALLGKPEKIKKFIKFCVDRGADLNLRNEDGDRPLDVAVRNYEMLKKLVHPANNDLMIKEKMMHHFSLYTPQ